MRCTPLVRHDFAAVPSCTLDVHVSVRNCLTTSAAVTIQVEGGLPPVRKTSDVGSVAGTSEQTGEERAGSVVGLGPAVGVGSTLQQHGALPVGGVV